MAFIRVFFGTIFSFALLIGSSILVRNYLNTHVYPTSVPFSQAEEAFNGEWNVQATNNWFTVSTLNSIIECNRNESAIGGIIAECNWKWHNYYVHFSMKKKFEIVEKNGELFVSSDLLSFSEYHPIHVLEFVKGSHFILYVTKTKWMPEGSLIVMTKDKIISKEFLSHSKEIAMKNNIDVFLYTLVPQTSSGISDFLYGLGDQIWKLCLLSLFSFILLSVLMPHDVTSLQSFSYSAIPTWNFGVHKFHLTTVSFCSYHQSFLGRLSHLTIFPDMILWYPVFASWGDRYLISLLVIQFLQLLSYRELKFTILTSATYLIFATVGYYMAAFEYYCRMLILLSAVTKVAGHASENIPPPLSGDVNFINMFNLKFPIPLKLPFVVLFGIISELGTGMPTRNFTGAFYILLSGLGYSSSRFMPLEKMLELDRQIQKEGWKGYPALKEAIESQKGLLQF